MMRVVLPPLVLLHGFTQTRQSWRRTARALAGRYRALIPDLPGHGQASIARPASTPCTAYVRALAPARRSRSSATRWAAASRSTRRCSSTAWSGSCSSARARGSPTRRSAPRAARPTRSSRGGSRRSTSRRSRGNGARQPLFAGQPPRVAAAAHADRLRNTPAGLAAALRGLGTGVMEPLWERLRRADDPGDARHRRARREIPRARRGDACATTGCAPRRRAGNRPRGTPRGPGGGRRGDPVDPRSDLPVTAHGAGEAGCRVRSPTSPALRRPPRSRRGRSCRPAGHRSPKRPAGAVRPAGQSRGRIPRSRPRRRLGVVRARDRLGRPALSGQSRAMWQHYRGPRRVMQALASAERQ